MLQAQVSPNVGTGLPQGRSTSHKQTQYHKLANWCLCLPLDPTQPGRIHWWIYTTLQQPFDVWSDWEPYHGKGWPHRTETNLQTWFWTTGDNMGIKKGLCAEMTVTLRWMLVVLVLRAASLTAMFMGPTWGPSGAVRTHVGPVLAPRTLLSGILREKYIIGMAADDLAPFTAS